MNLAANGLFAQQESGRSFLAHRYAMHTQTFDPEGIVAHRCWHPSGMQFHVRAVNRWWHYAYHRLIAQTPSG